MGTLLGSKLNSRNDDIEKPAMMADNLAKFLSWFARSSCAWQTQQSVKAGLRDGAALCLLVAA